MILLVLKANRINYDFVFKKAWNLSSKCNNEATKNKNEKFLSEYSRRMVDTTDIESFKLMHQKLN